MTALTAISATSTGLSAAFASTMLSASAASPFTCRSILIAARFHIDHLKINRMIIHVHSGNSNLHLITDAVNFRGSFTDQCHVLFMEMIIIIGHRA
ncbi:hypothetical protein D3C81_1518920 [compost metagenome]